LGVLELVLGVVELVLGVVELLPCIVKLLVRSVQLFIDLDLWQGRGRRGQGRVSACTASSMRE
jgi:hypothetical protein